jgi:hypothetical protein
MQGDRFRQANGLLFIVGFDADVVGYAQAVANFLCGLHRKMCPDLRSGAYRGDEPNAIQAVVYGPCGAQFSKITAHLAGQ